MGLISRRELQAALLVSLFAVSAQGQAPTVEERLSDPVYVSWGAQEKVSKCVDCHYNGPNLLQVVSQQSNLTAFSRREELEEWLTKDKHTIARRRVEPFAESSTKAELDALIVKLDALARTSAEALRERGFRVDLSQVGLTEFPKQWIGQSNFLSRRICDKLWGDGHVETERGYQDFRDNCLTCHGGYKDGDSGFDLADKGDAQLGIDCLYCHQQSEGSWVADHTDPQQWRLKAPAEKTTAGMRNLVQTSVQADLCFDCHVGNRSKGMFVNHEMYAAGHPPLPSIELETFCGEMPQHWQTPRQLYKSLEGYPQRDQYFETNYPGVIGQAGVEETYWKTRKMLIGALAARKKTLDLIIETAQNHSWADYSLYDCAACHHELKSDSKRQQRMNPALFVSYPGKDGRYAGAPGRPRQSEWPDLLLYAGSLFAGNGKAVMLGERDLHLRFSEQPFGDPQRVAQQARELREAIDQAIKVAESKPIREENARKILGVIALVPEEKLLTYDAARQLMWAMHVIKSEMQAAGAQVEATGNVVRLIDSLDPPEIGPGQTGVDLSLPSGREQFIYPESVSKELPLRAAYDPDVLSTRLQEIARLMTADIKRREAQ